MSAGGAAASREVSTALDDFHDAAAKADEERYFRHFAPGGVFVGTDETERWDVPAFRAYAHPRFATGKGWVYTSVRRAIVVAPDGRTAWFDEDLRGEKLGPARGSGVLVDDHGHWLLAQYVLSLTVPNERVSAVQRAIDAKDKGGDGSKSAIRIAYESAYAKAVIAAETDLGAARKLLEDQVRDAAAHPEEDIEFWLHNELTWIRWAEGDIPGALGEVDLAKAALDRSKLPAKDVRALRLHELWDRAYLLVDPPKTRPAAEAARAAYERLAREANDTTGLAVLEVFFAVRTGQAKAASAAAARVDAENDSDLQDLYVLFLAAHMVQDSGQAAKLRSRICNGSTYLMKPLLVRTLTSAGHGCPK